MNRLVARWGNKCQTVMCWPESFSSCRGSYVYTAGQRLKYTMRVYMVRSFSKLFVYLDVRNMKYIRHLHILRYI